MIEQLFGSKTRVKLLRLFYANPNRSFYVREITRKINEQINSVRRELANLLSIGIIASENTNNRLYYDVNQTFDYYEPLAAIFGNTVSKKKTSKKVGTIEPQQDHPVMSIGNVELAFYTGQFTRDETSGVDLLLVGDISQSKLTKFIKELETQEGKEIRYTVIPLDEFNYRQQINDRFLSVVLASKKQILVDKRGLINKEK